MLAFVYSDSLVISVCKIFLVYRLHVVSVQLMRYLLSLSKVATRMVERCLYNAPDWAAALR